MCQGGFLCKSIPSMVLRTAHCVEMFRLLLCRLCCFLTVRLFFGVIEARRNRFRTPCRSGVVGRRSKSRWQRPDPAKRIGSGLRSQFGPLARRGIPGYLRSAPEHGRASTPPTHNITTPFQALINANFNTTFAPGVGAAVWTIQVEPVLSVRCPTEGARETCSRTSCSCLWC